MSDPWLVDAEAYVLGALTEPERTGFEEHLRSCAVCRAAVEEVGPLPALLDLIPPDVVAAIAATDPVTAAVPGPPAEQVPDSVLAGLLWSARLEARRRRTTMVVAALAVAAVAVLALALPASPFSLVRHAGSDEVEVLAMVASGPSQVTATVELEPVAWGTRIDVSCRYSTTGAAGSGGGYGDRASYALLVLGDDGSSEQVATWSGVPDRTITVPAATDRRLEEIASIELIGPDGEVLLSAEP